MILIVATTLVLNHCLPYLMITSIQSRNNKKQQNEKKVFLQKKVLLQKKVFSCNLQLKLSQSILIKYNYQRMGGFFSFISLCINGPQNRSPRTIKNENPKDLHAVIEQYKRKIDETTKMARLMKDPKKFKEFSAMAFQNFIQKLKEYQFPQEAINELNQCVKLLVGAISSGKSSLINSYFGKSLEVGIGQTTKQATLAHQQNNNGVEILLFDTPGECQTFNTENLENVMNIAKSNQVFILFNSSLKSIEHMVRTIATIKPNMTVLVRTQCDRFEETFNRTLEEEIEEDKKILRKWGISQIPIFRTSAFAKEGFDNSTVLKMMREPCIKISRS